jgi:hypothetical protein
LPRFADDQLGLMDHFGIKRFLFIGDCISGCFASKLMERAHADAAATGRVPGLDL